MSILFGTIITFAALVGGFTAMGGHISVIWQPWEFVIIGGMALGTFIVANPWKVVIDSGSAIVQALTMAVPKQRHYLDLLGLLYALMRELRNKAAQRGRGAYRRSGVVGDLQHFPDGAREQGAVAFICDYFRLIIIGKRAPHEIEALMDEEIETIVRSKMKPYSSMIDGRGRRCRRSASSRPCSASSRRWARSISRPKLLGDFIGSALVGTFAGIFLSYAWSRRWRSKVKTIREKQCRLYVIVKQTLLAFMNGALPQIAIEHGRKMIGSGERPSIDVVESETISGGAAKPGAASTGRASRSGLASEVKAGQTDQAADQLLGAAGISVERMPMLHVIFDQMTNLCAESLRSMSPSQSYFSLSGVASDRLSDILDRYEGEAIAAVFYAQAWDARVLIGFDRDFVYTMIELLFGADGAEPPLDMPRVFSNVELHVAEALFERFGKALQSSFSLASEVTFTLERVETRMDYLAIGRPNNMAVSAQILLQGLDRGGEMFIVIPHAASQSDPHRALSDRDRRIGVHRSEMEPATAQRNSADRGAAARGARGAVVHARRGREIPRRAGDQAQRHAGHDGAARVQQSAAVLVPDGPAERRLFAAGQRIGGSKAGIHRWYTISLTSFW